MADSVRIDKWLWAARCFKSRAAATDACNAGHVKHNGDTAKPAKPVRAGDRIDVRTEGGLRELEVVGLADKRGPAAVARTLYIDHSPPPPPRELVGAAGERERGTGRPTKQDRREIRRLRGY